MSTMEEQSPFSRRPVSRRTQLRGSKVAFFGPNGGGKDRSVLLRNRAVALSNALIEVEKLRALRQERIILEERRAGFVSSPFAKKTDGE